jgi:hypothetical protein
LTARSRFSRVERRGGVFLPTHDAGLEEGDELQEVPASTAWSRAAERCGRVFLPPELCSTLYSALGKPTLSSALGIGLRRETGHKLEVRRCEFSPKNSQAAPKLVFRALLRAPAGDALIKKNSRLKLTKEAQWARGVTKSGPRAHAGGTLTCARSDRD